MLLNLQEKNILSRICLPKITDLSKINDLHVHSIPRRLLTMIYFKLSQEFGLYMNTRRFRECWTRT